MFINILPCFQKDCINTFAIHISCLCSCTLSDIYLFSSPGWDWLWCCRFSSVQWTASETWKKIWQNAIHLNGEFVISSSNCILASNHLLRSVFLWLILSCKFLSKVIYRYLSSKYLKFWYLMFFCMYRVTSSTKESSLYIRKVCWYLAWCCIWVLFEM